MAPLKLHHALGCLILALCLGRAAHSIDRVVLTSGESLRGEVIEQTDEHIVLRHAILGDLPILLASIESVTLGVMDEAEAEEPAEEASAGVQEGEPGPVAESAEVVAEPVPDTVPEDDDDDEWTSHLDVGFNSTSGTTNDTNLRIAIESVWSRPENVITLDSSYIYSASDGDTNESRFTAGIHSEWPRPDSPWSIFAQARYDYDEFNTWISRVTGGAGLSYRLFDIEEPIKGTEHTRLFRVKLRAGLGVAREFGSMNKDVQPEGILGADLLWQLNSWQDLTASTTYFPNLSDNEFRIVSKVEWRMKLDRLDGINLKLGLAHEYQSRTAPGISPDQLSIYATLGIDF